MPIVRLPNGELRDEIRMPVFDTIKIAAAESPVGIRRFFSAVQGKTLAQTNLRQNNMLETAVSYRVQGMGLDVQNYYAANKQALPIIMENSSMVVKIGEKDYWSGPFTFLSGRLNAAFSAATTASATTINDCYQRFGDVAVQSVILQGKHVVDINPLQSFVGIWTCDSLSATELALSTPAANTQLNFLFSFKGLMRRPVQ